MERHMNVHEVCRICLREVPLVDILKLGAKTSMWLSDINSYFKVQLTVDDDKSICLCRRCMGKIKTWRKHVERAGRCQYIVDYLDTVYQNQIVGGRIKKEDDEK
ncbi:uncharacterized protein LOC132934402 [Metopolophium dirhodum]|uniref:uncharacterized protein LOC132934189 n=1 Tax=Metopolophium dirhodum TaxID=44670 RepID=UPI00298F7D80|nr:uncharacterized protein LOC132934189 [Metopolophium dirhodum]XP_060856694.1 uncharacterized protein LOC132934402 [Metopolophium dirhodum]